MEEKKDICSKCGNERGIGMYSLISKMCDDCYEKENYFTPDRQYNKEYIKLQFDLPGGEYSVLDLILFHKRCEDKIFSIIKKDAINKKQYFACVFHEFKLADKTKELIRNRKFELEYSYFFTNNRLDLAPNFEDRNKEKSWLICLDNE